MTSTSSFVSYTKEGFGDDEQIELSNFFRKLSKHENISLMLSNSYCEEFFQQIYDGFNINIVSARRMINSAADKRNAINEILITNY